MSLEKLYRDDDINVYTSIGEFLQIHEVFRKYKKIHTVACEMKDLWYNKSLFWLLINDPFINVELHGWDHTDYSQLSPDVMFRELQKAIAYWETNAKRMLGLQELPELKKITTFLPPWNKISDHTKTVCEELGIRLSYKPEDCYWMFHFWSTTPKEVEEKLR